LLHSTNAGATFEKFSGVQAALSLGFGKAPPGRKYPALFLGGKANDVEAIFRSDDEAKTWVRLNDDQHQFGRVNHVTGDPRIYGRVYLATGGRGVIYGDLSSSPASLNSRADGKNEPIQTQETKP
jgi:xyloglucan-specific exo-beta-1,4-glucanase